MISTSNEKLFSERVAKGKKETERLEEQGGDSPPVDIRGDAPNIRSPFVWDRGSPKRVPRFGGSRRASSRRLRGECEPRVRSSFLSRIRTRDGNRRATTVSRLTERKGRLFRMARDLEFPPPRGENSGGPNTTEPTNKRGVRDGRRPVDSDARGARYHRLSPDGEGRRSL